MARTPGTQPRNLLRIINMPDVSQADFYNRAPRALRRAPHSAQPCAHCPGHCCERMVAVTMVEAQRIALTLGMDAQRVAEPFAADPAFLGDCAPEPVMLAEGPRYLRMVRRLDTLHCTFWMDVGGVGRCGIYALRPHVCAVFPVHFRQGAEEVHMGSPSPCPTQWLQTPALVASVDEHHAQWKQDRRLEARLLKAWAASSLEDRGFDGYCTFSQGFVATHLKLPLPEPKPSPAQRALRGAGWKATP